jgi:hypothetical protein
MGIIWNPALAVVAEPLPAPWIDHPETTLGVAQEQLGYLDAEFARIEFSAIAEGS